MQSIIFTFENDKILDVKLQNKDLNYVYTYGSNVDTDKYYSIANIHKMHEKLTESAAELRASSSKKEKNVDEKVMSDVHKLIYVPEKKPYVKEVEKKNLQYIPGVIDVGKQKKTVVSKLPEETKEVSSRKKCGRVLKAGPHTGDKCSRGISKYGMCKYHFQKWKKAHPFLKTPNIY